MEYIDKNFQLCEKCGKKLIERLPNGVFKFVFGKNMQTKSDPPVMLFIHGSVQIKCIRRSCRHINTFTYLPNQEIVFPEYYT